MKYRITINGKPAREAPEPVDEDAMKVAVMDIQLSFAPCRVRVDDTGPTISFDVTAVGDPVHIKATIEVEEVP